ncbi:MAG: PEP-CTERM sorting domain-containing protein [Phycisphaeraceae bacterium]|nr:PEP-CTERM sorting domain-containing protein [Phycisphaeraceae bacterium]
MLIHKGLVAAVVMAGALAAPAIADWNPGDPYKMHYPQLPDPNGWDVRNTYYTGLADDFMCIETGPVLDFHIWTSRKADMLIHPEDIEFIHTAIYSDIPDPDGTGPAYSQPGARLWHHDWNLDPAIGAFTVRPYGSGDQGWFDPLAGIVLPHDHLMIDQWNFFIDEPFAFVQTQGEIYWLEISFKLTPLALEQGKRIGWKTSLNHFNDDAVYREIVVGQDPIIWNELIDPLTQQSLDLAFVITPEPATLLLLGLGAAAMMYRRNA